MRHLIPDWEITEHVASISCPCEPVIDEGTAMHVPFARGVLEDPPGEPGQHSDGRA